jgi:hypothetical protein
MNSDELTQSLNEATDAPSTQPLMKELLADVRELKANAVTKSDFLSAFGRLEQAVARIEAELIKVNVRLDGIETEQKLMRHGMGKIIIRQSQSEERIMELEQKVFGDYKIAA